MTSRWQAVLIKCKYEPRILPLLLALLRIGICFWPQTGYMHPDEFFQSPDIVAGKYFNSKTQPTWEFTTDHPIRCMLIPSLLNQFAFRSITLFNDKPSAYMLLVAPRLVYTIFSFLVDFSLYKLCQYYSSRGLWYLPISVIFQSSFVCISCLTRSFSNTPEVVIYGLLLVVVCQAIRPRFRILFVTPTRSTPVNERVKSSKQFLSSILVGVLITIGTFNRPTFPCFALVPGIYWLFESLKRNSYSAGLTFKRAIIPLAVSAALTALTISAYDTIYYRDFGVIKDAIDHLLRFEYEQLYTLMSTRWVLTPYNFIKYNINVDNLTKHGINAPYTHMAVNIPLAFNVLGLMFYSKLYSLLMGTGIYRLLFSTHRVYALMLLSTLTSTILLSFIPHQEFRFLLPLIVPLVYVFSFNIYTSNRSLSIWLLINIILIYFYGAIHQSGVARASLDLDPILRSQLVEEQPSEMIRTNVVAFKCYVVPSYLWNVPQNDRRFNFNLLNTFEDINENLEDKLGQVIDMQQKFPAYTNIFYIMMPRIYEQKLTSYLDSKYSIDSSYLQPLHYYSGHFSGEELTLSIDHIRKSGLNTWKEAFGFSLMQLDLTNWIQQSNHTEQQKY